ncbi:DUF1146 domain-containing protein [Alicyclobacillus cycloheptanicus]|uniref:Membrane protein YwzB n=1 Tax=Alicyclobacillus cycloheptanicus TaxID=1457 RepID=A0ABT9XI71_9BACL|nr:DUF1146 family protein [Alicyclobacillus cycloheptanicus]MDQ0189406.1 putative membrane protein YwzB [Alicyclobacillus cycloheptanicus]WDM02280.1 DUF1146 domain-containing protein [Alicyclobacillus cycloheptanicus]
MITTSNAAANIGLMHVIGMDALMFIVAFLFGMYMTWRAIGILRWDKFTADPFGAQARLLRVLIGMVGGFLFGFVIAIFFLATQLFSQL